MLVPLLPAASQLSLARETRASPVRPATQLVPLLFDSPPRLSPELSFPWRAPQSPRSILLASVPTLSPASLRGAQFPASIQCVRDREFPVPAAGGPSAADSLRVERAGALAGFGNRPAY